MQHRTADIFEVWRCKVGMHNWVKKTNDEGGRCLECSRWGKEDNIPDFAGPRIAI
jgi:hypothetical protein